MLMPNQELSSLVPHGLELQVDLFKKNPRKIIIKIISENIRKKMFLIKIILVKMKLLILFKMNNTMMIINQRLFNK
jgi:hypothetical protein